ncbi:hypothetical protein NET03_10865 [Thermomicrobium sp. CFH 73360]|uniref:hypothetical protein n=1 Tax=Thermomicrobium sp. CFH 73360 TaxID=2951987 RepID=UPI00207708A2|nr:hypothetical protein [Thermomicrobium sp. CFH 73360]
MWKQALVVLAAVTALVAALPVREASTPPFASPAFEQLWLKQQNGQLDLWGQTPLAWRIEPYTEAPAGRRLVQYFDRGRMELTAQAGSSRTLVTQGRLAWELTTGQIALGSDLVARRPPPDLPIDGGSPDPRVPTYAALARLVATPASDRTTTNRPLQEWLTADGTLHTDAAPAPVRPGRFVSATGHNLPDVTVALFDRSPLGPDAWVETFGYPISEPVWAYYRRGTTALPSLIQVFERRILVYTPSLPTDQRFTIANTGRHYYRWRYGVDPSKPWPSPLPGAELPLTVPQDFRAGLFLEGVRDPVDLTLAPDGNLLILTAGGSLLLVTAEDAEGRAARLTTFASGFINPRGLATTGPWVYVADDRGLTRLRDDDGDGIADRTQLLPLDIHPLPGAAGAPVADHRGRIYLAATTREAPTSAVVLVLQDDQAFPLVPAPPGLVRLFTWGELLFAVVDSGDNHTRVERLDLTTGTARRRPFLELPIGFDPLGGLAYTAQLWADPIPGTLFFWGTRDTVGALLRAVPRADGEGADLFPFLSGLVHPVSMTAGLDGTLYVADAGTGRVVKLIPSLRAPQ